MAIRLVFLGRLADAAGAPEIAIGGDASSLAEIYRRLDPALHQALADPRVRIAINGALVAEGAAAALRDGDEVAFLPPVSGG